MTTRLPTPKCSPWFYDLYRSIFVETIVNIILSIRARYPAVAQKRTIWVLGRYSNKINYRVPTNRV